MYICIRLFTYVYTQIHTHTHTYAHIRTHAGTQTHIHAHAHAHEQHIHTTHTHNTHTLSLTHSHSHARTQIHTHAHKCTNTPAPTNTPTNTRTNTPTNTHTNTHTHKHTQSNSVRALSVSPAGQKNKSCLSAGAGHSGDSHGVSQLSCSKFRVQRTESFFLLSLCNPGWCTHVVHPMSYAMYDKDACTSDRIAFRRNTPKAAGLEGERRSDRNEED